MKQRLMLEDGIRVKTLSGTPSSFPTGRHPLTRPYATTFPSLPPPNPSSPHIDIYIYTHTHLLLLCVFFLFIGCVSLSFDPLQVQQIGKILFAKLTTPPFSMFQPIPCRFGRVASLFTLFPSITLRPSPSLRPFLPTRAVVKSSLLFLFIFFLFPLFPLLC